MDDTLSGNISPIPDQPSVVVLEQEAEAVPRLKRGYAHSL